MAGNGVFIANPDTMRREGGNQADITENIVKELSNISKTVEDMANNNYVSPEAEELRRQIEAKKQELERDLGGGAKTYSDYNIAASNNVEANQQNCIDSIKL